MNTLSKGEKDALKDYQGWNFDEWNDNIRDGYIPSSLRDHVDNLDKLMDRQSTEETVMLYRSLKTDGGKRFAPNVNEFLDDESYMSCSQNPNYQALLEDEWYTDVEESGDDFEPCPHDTASYPSNFRKVRR